MQHNYTNSELDTAVGESFDITGDAPLLDVSFNGLRKFLDALPEPQDEWEACTIDQIRKGDKVRWQEPGREDTCIYEIIALQTTPEDPGWLLYSKTESYYFPPGAVVDRIPVTHPDPAVHRYIVDHDDHDMLYQSYVSVQSNKADDLYYSPENYLGVAPEQFTNWSEAVVKVVADDE